MTKVTIVDDKRVLVQDARLSYPSLFEPNSFNGQDPRYEASLLISKDDTEAVDTIKSAIQKAAESKGQKLTGRNQPLRDGDVERPDDPTYHNMYYFNARSKYAPAVVTKYMDPTTKKPIPATEEDVYAGCYVNVVVTFYPYSFSGGGVAAGLGDVQFERDGDRLGGRSSSVDVFDFSEQEETGDNWFV